MFVSNPSIYTLPHVPLPTNSHPSATLDEQQETEQLISSAISLTAPPFDEGVSAGSPNIPSSVLRKTEHSQFLASTMFKLPSAYVGLDASKPWLLFWTVHSLDLLGISLDQGIKDRAISTLLHFQSPLGGFAGGPSNTQLPHLLPTYAATSSLAIVGNAGPGGGWEALAAGRQACYDFFMRCKRPDGSFVVCEGGEVDVRGTYCLLVVASLLDILTPELLHNVDNFIAACQTYEGGFACSAFPFTSSSSQLPSSFSIPSEPTSRAAMAEAHGGYTSCALSSHWLLQVARPLGKKVEYLDPSYPKSVDVRAALRWSILQQGEAIEAGGFRGRTNKLVDGCYGWWVGGGFAVLEDLIRREKIESQGNESNGSASVKAEKAEASPSLFNRVALQEFILVAAQREAGQAGGLRDKPKKRPDLYHTCNNLSGLSSAQHQVRQSSSRLNALRAKFDSSKGLPPVKPTKPEGGWKTEEEWQAVRREVWSQCLGWENDDASDIVLGGKDSRVNCTTPVFNILLLRLKPFINYFYGQEP